MEIYHKHSSNTSHGKFVKSCGIALKQKIHCSSEIYQTISNLIGHQGGS